MNRLFVLAVVAVFLTPFTTQAQYDGTWLDPSASYNDPDFDVIAGEVTNFHVYARYSCGGSFYTGHKYVTTSSSISGDTFQVSFTVGFASYTYRGYFVSDTLCTGRFSYVSSGCGGGAIGSGNWSVNRIGDDPVINISPDIIDFGEVLIGTSSDRVFQVSNTSGGILSGEVFGVSSPFNVESGSPYTVGSLSSTLVDIRFAPVSEGSFTQVVVFTGGGTVTGIVSGIGVQATSRVIDVSGNLAFGSVEIGSQTQAVMTIANIGDLPLTVSSISYPAAFTGAWSGVIGPGMSTNVTVTFRPTQVQSYGGTAVVSSDADSGSDSIACSGSGVGDVSGVSIVGPWTVYYAWGLASYNDTPIEYFPSGYFLSGSNSSGNWFRANSSVWWIYDSGTTYTGEVSTATYMSGTMRSYTGSTGTWYATRPYSYEVWASGITNGLTDYHESAAGDGYQNLLKYVTGSSPSMNDGMAGMWIGMSGSTNGPYIAFYRDTNAVDAVLVTERAMNTPSGLSWTGFATNMNGNWDGASNVVEMGVQNPVTVHAHDPVAGATSSWLRLRVLMP